MSIPRRYILMLAISVAFFAALYVSTPFEGTAAFFAAAVAVLLPSFSPYLLVLLGSVQDAPGMSNMWGYACFFGVSLVAILYFLGEVSTSRITETTKSNRWLYRLAFLALLVILYGLFSSLSHDLLGGYEQSPERPYYLVAMFMSIMVITAVISVRAVLRQEDGRGMLLMVSALCIFHMLLVSVVQIFVGPDFFSSSSGAELFDKAEQLTEAAALGLPRITGPFTSPNAFALTAALLFMMILGAGKRRKVGVLFAVVYLFTGMYLSIVTLSKAMLAYFALTSLILMFFANIRLFFAACILAAVPLAFIIKSLDFDTLMLAFRMGDSGHGFRSIAWGSTISAFGWSDWLFGTGLSHWKVLFDTKVGYALADPHTYVLSVPGTFGVIGVTFYAVLVAVLGLVSFSRGTTQRNRVIALMLLVLFLGKDLVSIPYVFGSTPVTFLLWFVLGLTLSGLAFELEKRPFAAAETTCSGRGGLCP